MNNRILVVDDEEFILTLIEFNLQQAGFEVITAMDGEKWRFKKRQQKRPDLIILDFNASKKWMVWKYVKNYDCSAL